MSGSGIWNKKIAMEVVLFAASQAVIWYSVKWVFDSLGPTPESKAAKAKSLTILKRMGREDLELSDYERIVAAELIHPDDIDIKFSDVGGLDNIVSDLRESVIYPLVYPSLFSGTSRLISAPKGVLLYGPPGCGKTMLAKALAKESGATFINISAASMTSKWYGESNKLVAGLFSLARKVQPTIIFIDEIDSFLRERNRGDHEATGMIKAEFMTLWDGLLTANDRILILGATNRPFDIDQAIFRRLPKRFAVGLPDQNQRVKILRLMLQGTPLQADFSIDALAALTQGSSGSDLKELCRNAAMAPIREYLKEAGGNREVLEKSNKEGVEFRPLRLDDFVVNDGVEDEISIPGLSDRTRIDIGEDEPDCD